MHITSTSLSIYYKHYSNSYAIALQKHSYWFTIALLLAAESSAIGKQKLCSWKTARFLKENSSSKAQVSSPANHAAIPIKNTRKGALLPLCGCFGCYVSSAILSCYKVELANGAACV